MRKVVSVFISGLLALFLSAPEGYSYTIDASAGPGGFTRPFLTKEKFLQLTTGIDSAIAYAMADNLTDADWYEVDEALLLDAFQATLEARKRFAWAKKVPRDIFLQYVVPLRVESEPLQHFRRKFLNQIGPRLDKIDSLARAALEVNLYLGERVGFKSTDRRDQGPLTTLASGFGRCEELVIVAIDAMRSVGIPARWVWVPSWSAIDNNHVWIEVYTENGWKYMGAGEPEKRLNKAWFDKKVQRAGIILSKGRTYEAGYPAAGSKSTENYVNVTRNYLPPASLKVEFPGNWGKEDQLWLAVFNFGALRPLTKLTPVDGVATLEIGNGDFVLMGVHQGKLFFQKFTAYVDRETHVKLDVSRYAPQDFILTYPWPPVPADHKNEPDLLDENRVKLAHELRKKQSDNRNWPSNWLDRFISDGGGFSEGEELFKVLKRSPGNETTVLHAVFSVVPEQRKKAIFILSLLSDKNLREVRPAILSRWLTRTAGNYAGDEDLKSLVLNPQIDYEYPGTGLPENYVTDQVSITSLDKLREEVAQYSSLVNPQVKERPLPPVTIDNMLKNGMSISSRNAALWWTDRLRRSGIPARRQPLDEWLEFYYEGKWHPLYPGQPKKLGDRNALPEARAHYAKPASVKVQWQNGVSLPRWKRDFMLLPLKDNGLPDYLKDTPKSIGKEKNSVVLKLAPQPYLFMAGKRNGRGDVAVQVRLINLKENESISITLDLVPPPEPAADKNDPAPKVSKAWPRL